MVKINIGVDIDESQEPLIVRKTVSFEPRYDEERLVRRDKVTVMDVFLSLPEIDPVYNPIHYKKREQLISCVPTEIGGKRGNWWYSATLPKGRIEPTAYPMEEYVLTDGSTVIFHMEDEENYSKTLSNLRKSYGFREKLSDLDDYLVVRSVYITGINEGMEPEKLAVFDDVKVRSHGKGKEYFNPGVVTVLDALLSLEDKGLIGLEYSMFYEMIKKAGERIPIYSYWVWNIFLPEATEREKDISRATPSTMFGWSYKVNGWLLHQLVDKYILHGGEELDFHWKDLTTVYKKMDDEQRKFMRDNLYPKKAFRKELLFV